MAATTATKKVPVGEAERAAGLVEPQEAVVPDTVKIVNVKDAM